MAGISDPTTPAAVQHELDLVAEAIALVAAGRSSRVVLASLHHGNEVIEPARQLAALAGVRVRALEARGGPGWTGPAIDIAVERSTDG